MGIKQRGGGKQKTLFRTVTTPVSFSVDDPPEKRKLDIAALKEIVRRGSLKVQLADYEKTARKILKKYDLKHTGYGYVEYIDNYDLPLPASYAADILFLVKSVRDHLKKGNTESAAIEALKLGWHVAALQAELAVSGKEGTRTGPATKTRKGAKDLRQERMKIIAEKKDWRPGQKLSNSQLQVIYTLLRERHKEYESKPGKQTLSDDAKEIGLKGNK